MARANEVIVPITTDCLSLMELRLCLDICQMLVM